MKNNPRLLSEILYSQRSLAFFAVDHKFRYTFFTPTHAQLMFALWGKEIRLGDKPLSFLTKTTERKKATENFKQALAGKTIVKEESFSGEKKVKRYFENRYAPIADSKGKIRGVSIFSFEITSRKLADIETEQSQSLLESTINSSANGILVVDLKGKSVLFNKKFLDLMEIPTQVTDTRVDEKMLADVLPRLKNPERFVERVKYLYTHPEEEGRDLMEFKDGKVYARYTAPQKLKGKITGRVWSFLDITEQEKAELELKYRESRYRTLQEASFGGIGLHKNGIIIDANSGLSQLTGFPLNELIGINGTDLIAPEYRDVVIEKIKSNYPDAYDVIGLRKDGSRYYLEVRGKSFQAEGKTLRVTEFRDITERKLVEEKIRDQNMRLASIAQNLRKKNDQLEEFTQIVSHNLRSPVGNISALLDHYEKATSSEERAELIRYIKSSSESLLATMQEMNEILKMSQAGPMEVVELHFKQVLEKVITMLNANITSQRAVIETDFQEEKVIFSPLYLESILLNLVSNALKYASSKRQPIIRVSTVAHEETVVLKVEDNGLGIDLSKFGHQMFKLRKTFHQHPDSRGIGLFMVKNQVEVMGGEIYVTSEVEKGSTFTIHFGKQAKA
jgi:PAS domain S-box-containing protein